MQGYLTGIAQPDENLFADLPLSCQPNSFSGLQCTWQNPSPLSEIA